MQVAGDKISERERAKVAMLIVGVAGDDLGKFRCSFVISPLSNAEHQATDADGCSLLVEDQM